MKPIKLTLEGVRSFSEKTVVDFSEVIKDGLFGIFGNTGSGKSTILDGMILALYGRLPGLEMSEIVNARSQKASVALEFEIKIKGERKRYLVERVVSLKKDGGYKDAKATLFDMGENLLIASQPSAVNSEIEKILGLGVNEFTKCIILPQGEFAKFVSSSKAERVKIIEKLFDLGRFGDRFNVKLKVKLSSLYAEKDKLSALVAPYVEATPEVVEQTYKEIKTIESEIKSTNEKIAKNDYNIKEFEKFYDKHKKLSVLKERLDEIEKENARNKKVTEYFSLYPRAEKIVAASREVEETAVKLEVAKKAFADARAEYDRVYAKKKELEDKGEEMGLLLLEKGKLEKSLYEMDAVKGEVRLLREKRNERDEKRKEYALLDKKVLSLQAEIDDLDLKISRLNEKIESLNALCDLDNALKGVRDGVLREEFLSEISYYDERIAGLANYDESLLKTDVSDEYNKRKAWFEGRIEGLSVGEGVEFDEIENVKKYTELKDGAVKNLNLLTGEKGKKNVELSSLKERRAQVLTEGKALSDSVSSIEQKVLNIVDNINDFDNNYVFCNSRLLKISQLLSDYDSEVKKVDALFLKKSEDHAVLSKEYQLLADDYKIKEEKANCLFGDGVDGVKKAVEIVESVGDYEKAKLRREKDAAEKLKLTSEIEEIDCFLSDRVFDLDDGDRLSSEKKILAERLAYLTENLGKSKKKATDLAENCQKRKEIEKEISLVDREIIKFGRLSEVVKDKKFAEYVAAEFLSDVAADARKILLELSCGKYDVVYLDGLDGKDGFFIVDNLRGGVRRSIATLSGGETFLVSLSLALSLSAQVYSKSDKPMEFFFLDEGFGTLDDDLVDVVLDSLSKLRNERFTIGLISHLSELKSRIDRKIIVEGATETKGSSVRINVS
ncbi:MAG: SMC family ATPase [Clostridia bacterium]|nr:SMC family ATPase [Clostridia bacterium]